MIDTHFLCYTQRKKPTSKLTAAPSMTYLLHHCLCIKRHSEIHTCDFERWGLCYSGSWEERSDLTSRLGLELLADFAFYHNSYSELSGAQDQCVPHLWMYHLLTAVLFEHFWVFMFVGQNPRMLLSEGKVGLLQLPPMLSSPSSSRNGLSSLLV